MKVGVNTSDLPVPADLQHGLRHSDIQAQYRSASLLSQNHGCDVRVLDAAVEGERMQVHVLKLIESYRVLGHLQADTNPLNELYRRPILKELTLEYHRLADVVTDQVFDTGDLYLEEPNTLDNIYRLLRNTYTGSIGAEYMHIMDTEEKCWLQSRLESSQSKPELSKEQKIQLYDQLVAAETFERFLSTRYVGQKTFSLEGGESLIPLLSLLTQQAGESEIKEFALGMAHRGRLNVLINILGKPPETL